MVYHLDLNPYLLGPFQIGSWEPIGIRWYSLPYLLGFVAIYAALYRAVVRRRIPNGDLDRLEESSLILIASVIIGGRLGYFILNSPQTLTTWAGWVEVLKIWHGGMAFFGAAVAVFAFEYFYCRRYRLGFWHGADRICWILSIALGFGRVANFVNGELFGVPTNGSWGVVFPDAMRTVDQGLAIPRHPVQLYSAVSHWILGLFMLYLLRRKPRTKFERVPGYQAFVFFVGYGLLRFITDFWRVEQVYIGPLNGGQWLSLVFCVVGVVAGWARYRAVLRSNGPCDWYPPEGVDADLPAECHAFLDSQAKSEPAASAPRPKQSTAKGKRRRP